MWNHASWGEEKAGVQAGRGTLGGAWGQRIARMKPGVVMILLTLKIMVLPCTCHLEMDPSLLQGAHKDFPSYKVGAALER